MKYTHTTLLSAFISDCFKCLSLLSVKTSQINAKVRNVYKIRKACHYFRPTAIPEYCDVFV